MAKRRKGKMEKNFNKGNNGLKPPRGGKSRGKRGKKR